MDKTNADIYEYQFNALFNQVRPIIGRNAVQKAKTLEDEELERFTGKSELLFDISGPDFSWHKECESDYRWTVEVYITKIIENLLARRGIKFEEKYYPDCKEQYSIVYTFVEKRIEAYFLFDITYEDPKHSDYDAIAEALKHNSSNPDKIEVYICRDNISKNDLAWMVNIDEKWNLNGLIEVFPLEAFFEKMFDAEEYSVFQAYAKEFYNKCNSIISYKTVILPTQRTLVAFKQKKQEMLNNYDYKAVAQKGNSGYLSEREFTQVYNRFKSRQMYLAMVSDNDFADSFISAEWSYDVFYNAMGELDLTGIVAGYLKSVEQLMYKIAQFHKNEGIKINIQNKFLKQGDARKQEYTDLNEAYIDSTLGSLNEYLKDVAKAAKPQIDSHIRGCIYKAVELWKNYQRNGYFHKHNLYKRDNKIGDVRELTLYLYFLILGGFNFSTKELFDLGIYDHDSKSAEFSLEAEYHRFKEWIEGIITYDLPENVPGICVLFLYEDNFWTIRPILLKSFEIDSFNQGVFNTNTIVTNHVRDILPFTWYSKDSSEKKAKLIFQDMIEEYKRDPKSQLQKIRAIVAGIGNTTQLIYYHT